MVLEPTVKVEDIPTAKEGEDEIDPDFLEDDTDEGAENLIEALVTLSDVDILFDTFTDPLLHARWDKTPKFLKHNLLKVKRQVKALLAEYPEDLYSSTD